MKYIHPIYTKYSCDDFGNIYGPRKCLKPTLHHTGYLVVSICNKSSKKQYRCHRFIYECIYGNIPNDKVLDHIDNNKTNNKISNLQLLSSGNNTRKARAIKNWAKSGEDNPTAKLSNDQAFNLFRDLELGLSNNELGNKYKLHPRYVSLIRHKRRWKNLWQEYEASTTISTESRV